MLYQNQDDVLRVTAYASRSIKDSERNYPTHKLEFLALKWAVCDKFYDYLYGNQFSVTTDNNPLSYVLTSAKLDATGHRWLAELSNFNFTISYKSGKSNVDADFLSWLPGHWETVSSDVIEATCQSIQAQIEGICDADYVSCHAQQTNQDQHRNDWKDLQEQDDVLKKLREHLVNGRETKYSYYKQNYLKSQQILNVLEGLDKLVMKNRVIYRKKHTRDDQEILQLILPSQKRKEAIQGLHDQAGHMG